MATDVKKPPLADLLDGGSGDAPESPEEESSDDSLTVAAGAVREAIDSGSDEDLAKALSGFMKIGG